MGYRLSSTHTGAIHCSRMVAPAGKPLNRSVADAVRPAGEAVVPTYGAAVGAAMDA